MFVTWRKRSTQRLASSGHIDLRETQTPNADIGGVWLGCVRWMFVFRRQRVTSFDSIPGLLRETRSLSVKQR